VGTNDS